MKESGKGTGASHRHGWVRQGLVVVEVALSLVLLLGAGLLIRSFIAMVNMDMGLDPSRLAYVVPRFEKRDEPGVAERHLYYAEAMARARAVPGVSDVTLSSTWPFGGLSMQASRPGMEAAAGVRVSAMLCSENYFDVVGLALIRGSAFSKADVDSVARVAVVSRSLATRFFRDENPVGESIVLPDLTKPPTSMADPVFTIVGVVEDVRNEGPLAPPIPGVYLPTTLAAVGHAPRFVLARTTGDPEGVVPRLERAVGAVRPDVAAMGSGTIADVIRRGFHAQPRFSLAILTTFAVTGLVLVAIGVYGVMAYAVSRRSQEFAIRMALGATRQDVVRIVLKSGVWMLGAGVVVGVSASRLANRAVSRAMPSAQQVDLVSGVVAVSVVVLVGVTACLLPALRASRTSPMRALRQD